MLNVGVSPKFMCWNPNPQGDSIKRYRAFGRCLDHEGGAFMNETCSFKKETSQSSITPSTMWRCNKKSQESPLAWLCWYPDLGLPSFRTVKNEFLLLVSNPVCSIWLLLCSRQVVSDSMWPHELQHTRLLCPPLSPRVCTNSCPLSWWCYLTISSSATSFSFCLQSHVIFDCWYMKLWVNLNLYSGKEDMKLMHTYEGQMC